MGEASDASGSSSASWCGVKESGVMLLARAASRPALDGLCRPLLLGEPLSPGDVIQVLLTY